jgi:alkanesulfonate monooxygenase SsuD/methylene tetrahydromethanopterin reductase-like flavin-dependent oxidoreductase (luciferase family)
MNADGIRLPITFSTTAGNQSFEQSLATAQAAEAAGYTGVAFADRPHDPILDGWTLATAVAARTDRIRFFHTTLNIPYRFPAVMAKETATFDLISKGRLDLCLGAGGEGNRPLYDTIGVPLAEPGVRLRGLREVIAILRGLWANDRFTFKGKVYQVENAPGQPHPVQNPIPIWVGARMPVSLKLTGEIADGFIKNGGWGTVDEVRELNQGIDAAAKKAGREPNAIRRILNGAAYLARDKAEADAFRARAAAPPPAGAAPVTGGLIGTAEEILDQIRTYRAAGVDSFNLRFPQDGATQLPLFGKEIIPAAAKL